MSEAMEEAVTHMNDDIDALFYTREEVRRLEAELKGLKARQTELEHRVLDKMDAQGLQKAGTDLANVSVSTEEMPTVDPEHWEDVWNFVFENGYLELLRRQINSTSYRELKKLGVEIPYVSDFVKVKLNLRAA